MDKPSAEAISSTRMPRYRRILRLLEQYCLKEKIKKKKNNKQTPRQNKYISQQPELESSGW
jgi:hypothetical protein